MPAPCTKKYRRAVPAANAHGGFQRIVTSLTRPVSLPGRMGTKKYAVCTHGQRWHTAPPGIGGLTAELLIDSYCMKNARYRFLVRYRAFSGFPSAVGMKGKGYGGEEEKSGPPLGDRSFWLFIRRRSGFLPGWGCWGRRLFGRWRWRRLWWLPPRPWKRPPRRRFRR